MIIAYYTRLGYEIVKDGERIYEAGNSRFDSQAYLLPIEGPWGKRTDVAKLAEIKQWAKDAARELAAEYGMSYKVIHDSDGQADMLSQLQLA